MPRGVNAYDEGRIQGRNVANANRSNIVSPGIVTDGLVLHLDAENRSSYPSPFTGTTWYDLSERRSNATFNSVDYRGNYFFYFFGSYCTVSNLPLTAGRSVTFSIWNYGLVAKASHAIYLQGTNGRQFSVHLPFSGNDIIFDCADQGGNTFDRISKIATDAEYKNVWVLWTFVKDAAADAMYIYRNNQLWHSGTGKTKTISAITSLTIGARNDFQETHEAYVAFTSLYLRALTQPEIEQNFNATRARFYV